MIKFLRFACHNPKQEGATMRKIILSLAILFTATSFAYAMENHCMNMEKHAKEAVDAGKAGKLDGLKKHAQGMLKEADACMGDSMTMASSKDHAKEAKDHEETALEKANAGDLNMALKHAESALEHAEAANK
jgi:hypothetical protein